MSDNTLLLRMEGPLQAWGDNQSKFVIRRTAEAPTKSGVIGLLCAALGIPRSEAPTRLPALNALRMGVRIDRPGVRWWDYHTVGAGAEMPTAGRPKGDVEKAREAAMLTRREYLCDASFLVALQGDPALIDMLEAAVRKPVWPPYLGRKSCPPSRSLLENASRREFDALQDALGATPWTHRLATERPPKTVDCLVEWRASAEEPGAPNDALIWYDVPLSFDPPAHGPRFVVRHSLAVGRDGAISVDPNHSQNRTSAPRRPRADYRNAEYRAARDARLAQDNDMCVFCKSPLTKWNRTVQHITYRRAGGGETVDDLRSLCRLCHDAVTMIEYGYGMGMDRINPEEPRWRDEIIEQRRQIIEFRSLETRRRRLSPEEV